ncbi:MAG: ATPase V [Bacteroidaceae bacterium]|nr:ATPase V [Bacteroidaceae bacterium]
MIQKMKKLTFLVYHREYDRFLVELQKLGVLHIQPSADQSKAEPDSLRRLKEQLGVVQDVKASLMKLTGMFDEDIVPADADENLVNRVLAIAERLRIVENTLDKARRDDKLLAPWGDIDKAQMERMHQAGLQEYYYKVSCSYFDRELADYSALEVSRDKKFVYFITFSLDGKEPEGIAALPLTLPAGLYSEVRAQADALEEEKRQLIAERQEIAGNRIGCIKAYELELLNKIAREEADLDTLRAAGDTVMVLEGWFPVTQCAAVEDFLKKSDVYYEMRDPVDTDTVPTQFCNNRFNRMFERLTKMYGYPCYNEWDPTPVVAPFFTLFFAICMGDAMYGVIMMIYGMLEVSGKAKKTPILGEMLHGCGDILIALGAATTVIGLSLGTVFGTNIAEWTFISLSPAVKDYYHFVQGNFPGTTYSFQMVAAIIIGVLHLCIAMIVKAVLFSKKEGFMNNLGQWGWTLLMIGGIITGSLWAVGTLSQEATTYVLIGIGAVAALCIYFLNNVQRLRSKFVQGLIINPLAGLYDTYNMASGLLGDVLSYVRLYALCLAGGVLGSAFNSIGSMCADSFAGGIAVAILIYAIGHLLNLLLSGISAFVHPLRLNFVEYFKNSGYEGRGTAYEPFKNK